MSDISGHFDTGFRILSTTAEQLPDIECDYVILKALSGNTPSIFVGNSDVTNTVAADNATTGVELGPGESIKLEVPNVSRLWVIAASGTPGVSYMAVR